MTFQFCEGQEAFTPTCKKVQLRTVKRRRHMGQTWPLILMDLKRPRLEFQLWLSGLRTQLVSLRIWVWPLALRIRHCCKLWCRWRMWLVRSDVVWLWRRLVAMALIQPLAWELPYSMGEARKRETDRQTDRLTDPGRPDAIKGNFPFQKCQEKEVKFYKNS